MAFQFQGIVVLYCYLLIVVFAISTSSYLSIFRAMESEDESLAALLEWTVFCTCVSYE